MRRKKARAMSLLLSAALALGLGCGTAGATSGRILSDTASQGTVAQADGQVTFTTADYGVVVTLTSARLGDDVSFADPQDGERMLHTILVEPGCVGYSTTPDGRVFTDHQQVMETEEFSAIGMLLCHYFDVLEDGTIRTEGMSDNDLLGNSYAKYGLGTDERYDYDYCLSMTIFYADDGGYWITTQEALDRYCQVTGAQTQPAQIFTDVTPDDWYFDFVNMVVEKKLFAGNGDGTFAPENNMTYAEFLAVLSQFSGDAIPAAPAGGAWYDGYVQWAQPLLPAGIADGFNADAAITREDMAALFGTFLSLYDYSAQPVNTDAPDFSDESAIADYAVGGVELCWQLGIMGGNTDGTFAPDANATRAEVAVTMVQMARVMGR